MTPLEILFLISAIIGGINIWLFKKYYMPKDFTEIEYLDVTESKTPEVPQSTITESTPVIEANRGLKWGSREEIRHSIRVICDEEGLTLEQKNTLCATIQGESDFNLRAVNVNKSPEGITLSTDWGLCQWNDFYHGNEITPEEAVNNPEKAVRLMCQYWKRGQRKQWIAYKNGSYQQYL